MKRNNDFVMPRGFNNGETIEKGLKIIFDMNKREWLKCRKCGTLFESWGYRTSHRCKLLE